MWKSGKNFTDSDFPEIFEDPALKMISVNVSKSYQVQMCDNFEFWV